MLPKIQPIFDKPPSNLCLHEWVIVEKFKSVSFFDEKYKKCKHCDEIQQIENK